MAADGTIQIDVNLNSDPAVNSINQVDKKAEGLSGTFKAVGLAAAALVGGIVAVGKAAIDSFTESENATVKLQNQLGLTRKEADDLTKVAKNIYNKGFGESLDEVSDAVMNVRNNIGELNDADMEKVTKQSLALAKTFDGDVNEVTRAAGNIMKNFGVESDKAFDLLTNGAQNGLNFSGELFDNMAEYAPLWADMGFSAEEMFSILQSGAKEGVYNFDFLNDVMKEFGILISDGSKGTSDALGQLSKGTQDLYKGFVRGEVSGAQMAKVISEDLSTLDDQVQRNQIGVALFGTKWEDLGGDVVLSMLTAENAVGDLGGKTDEVTANMEQTTSQRMEGMKRSIMGSLAPLGGYIVTAVDESMKYLIELFNKYKDDIVNVVMETWGFIEPYIMGVLGAVVPFVQDILGKLIAFWDENGAQMVEAITNHWNNIMAIIEFVMPAILFVVEYAWEAIKTVIQGALDIILGAVEIFTGIFTGDFSKMWEGVKEIFSGAIDIIFGLMNLSFVGQITNLLIDFAKSIFDGIKNTLDDIVDIFKTTVKNVIESVEEMANKVIGFFSDLWTEGLNAVTSLATGVVDNISEMAEGMIDAIKGLPEQFMEYGKDIMQGLIDGLEKLNPVKIVGDIATGIKNKFTGLLGIHSPSRVFKAYGGYITDGLSIGVEDGMKDVERSIENLAKSTTESTEKAFSDVDKVSSRAYRDLLKEENDYSKKSTTFKQDLQKKTLELLQDELNSNKQAKETTLQYEVAYWNNSLNNFVKGSKEHTTALSHYNSAVESLESKRLENAKSYIQQQKNLNQLSLKDEVILLEQVVSNFKEGSSQRLEAQKMYKQSLENLNNEVININNDYKNKIKKINDDLVKQEEDLNKKYSDAYNKRYDTLVGFSKTFSEFTYNSSLSGSELRHNLQTQVDALKEWQAEINRLSSRGINSELFNQINDMGVSALAELQAINSFTDEELTEYSNLYVQKTEIARKQTELEMNGMKEDTKLQIQELRKVAETELDLLQNEWSVKIKGLTDTTDAELLSLRKIGEDGANNLLEGLKSMTGALVQQARNMANAVKQELSSAFELGSESLPGLELSSFGNSSYNDIIVNPFRGNSPTFSANSPILNGSNQNPISNNTSNTSSVSITNNFTPRESTPYESILKQEQMLRKLALELG